MEVLIERTPLTLLYHVYQGFKQANLAFWFDKRQIFIIKC